jgi:hypothetical protein
MPSDAMEPPFNSEHDALTAWIEHDRTHAPEDPPCERCIELDGLVAEARRG